jgi:uncharacterized protein (DUF1778 family)
VKKRIEIKVDREHHRKMTEKAESYGFTSLTDFILFCCLNARINCDVGTTLIEKIEKTSVQEPVK